MKLKIDIFSTINNKSFHLRKYKRIKQWKNLYRLLKLGLLCFYGLSHIIQCSMSIKDHDQIEDCSIIKKLNINLFSTLKLISFASALKPIFTWIPPRYGLLLVQPHLHKEAKTLSSTIINIGPLSVNFISTLVIIREYTI